MSSKYITPGSIWIELALWLIFFPAGIIYSLWRWTSRKPALPQAPTTYTTWDDQHE